jgi:hypothetical protein
VYHSHSHQSSVKHCHTRHAPDVSTTSRMWPIPNCSSPRCNHQPACVRWSLSADQHGEKTGLHDSTTSSPLPVPSISSSAGASAVRNFPARRFNCSTWSSHPYRDRYSWLTVKKRSFPALSSLESQVTVTVSHANVIAHLRRSAFTSPLSPW